MTMATVATRIAAWLAPWRQRWSALPAGDRRALSLLSLFLGAVLLWFGVASPAIEFAREREARLATAQADLAWMKANAAAARQARTVGSAGDLAGQTLLTAVNSTARTAGLNLQRFEPEGERRVRVTLEGAVFTDVMRWLVLLEQRYGLVVESLNADHQAQPGIVNIRLTLGVPT